MGVSWDVGIARYGYASVVWGLGMLGMVVGLGICVFDDCFKLCIAICFVG